MNRNVQEPKTLNSITQIIFQHPKPELLIWVQSSGIYLTLKTTQYTYKTNLLT